MTWPGRPTSCSPPAASRRPASATARPPASRRSLTSCCSGPASRWPRRATSTRASRPCDRRPSASRTGWCCSTACPRTSRPRALRSPSGSADDLQVEGAGRGLGDGDRVRGAGRLDAGRVGRRADRRRRVRALAHIAVELDGVDASGDGRGYRTPAVGADGTGVGDLRVEQAPGERGDVGGGGEVRGVLAVHAVGVQAGGDARRVRGERRAVGIAGLDAAALVAARRELERAPGGEVVRADAGLVARRRAAAVDRAAAVTATKVRLAGAVRRVVGDDLGLGGETRARRVALAKQEIAALAEAQRGGGDPDRKDERGGDRGAAGEGNPLHTGCDTTPQTELRPETGLSPSRCLPGYTSASSRAPGVGNPTSVRRYGRMPYR